MRQLTGPRGQAMTHTERTRLAFLTSTHVVDDLYQGAVPPLIGTLAGGWLADRWQRVGVLRVGYGLSAAAAALLATAPDLLVLFIAAFGLGIVLFGRSPCRSPWARTFCRTGSASPAA